MGTFNERIGHFKNIIDARALTAINRASVSTAIQMKIAGIPIGYIQQITETHGRPANPQYEVGTVGIIEHVPTQPVYTLAINKLGVYRLNFLKIMQDIGMKKKSPTLYNAIKARINSSNKVIDFNTLVEGAIPFDIDILESDPVSTGGTNNNSNAIFTTTWVDCYITGYTRTITASGNLTIAENCNLVARKPRFDNTATIPGGFPPVKS